jgi:hypothetical protein
VHLSALHVVQPQTGADGINAYYYLHHSADWLVAPDPEVDPGVLEDMDLEVQPAAGNRVRAFLEVAAPDGTPWAELRQQLMRFILDHYDRPLPWEGTAGRCFFRIDMEEALAAHWQQEADSLYRALRAVAP